MFHPAGILNKLPSWEEDEVLFKQWALGKTNEPFVNAHMKELLATGFMSNRGRQNVASYAVHNLNLPWIWCAQWFESWLIDHDPAVNYGNWQYIQGIGTDPKGGRQFDVAWQQERYDPDGLYTELWSNAKELE